MFNRGIIAVAAYRTLFDNLAALARRAGPRPLPRGRRWLRAGSHGLRRLAPLRARPD